MNEAKPFASLSSGLLARKGLAKPAMRPQGFSQFNSNIEDLGWNDMGHAPAVQPLRPSPFERPHEEHVPSPISALTPMNGGPVEDQDFGPGPAVVAQQRAVIAANFGESNDDRPVLATKARKPAIEAEEPIAEEPFEAEEPVAEDPVEEAQIEDEPQEEVAATPAAIVQLPVREQPVSKTSAKAKAAFTLRLEAERHLKLRLACAVTGRSAQQLVTEALDQLLKSKPEVEALVGQLPIGKSS